MPFEGLGLNPHLLKAIKESGYTRPTPIQTAAIPPAMEGRDIIGSAQTGTGKTAAFLLPILHNLLASGSKGGTRGLVLAPTRELAVQVEAQFRTLAKHAGLRSVAVYGGAAMDPQTRALRAGVDVVIATPGRLLDHLERGNLRCQQVGFLVLDEADRMLDMGFLPDIKKIIAAIPVKRQTMLFSATMPSEIARLAKSILNNPMIVEVGGGETMAGSIRHSAYPVPQHLKADILLTLLRETEMPSVLIFTRTRMGADRLAQTLTRAGFLAGALHSDRTQAQRLATLESFRRGKIKMLVATDIAARGIDVANISHVFNYDLPNSPETYVHRVGRTARAEASGDAITLVAPDEERALRIIERTLGPAIPRVKLPDFNYRAAPTSRPASPPTRPSTRPGARPNTRSHSDRRPPTSNSTGRYNFGNDAPAPFSPKRKRPN